MKNYIDYILLLVLGISLNACEDYYPDSAHPSLTAYYLDISNSSLNFPYEASTKEIYVSSMASSWQITNIADWLTFAPSNGDTSEDVAVSVTENPSADASRTCIATFMSNNPEYNYSKTIDVTQEKAISYIRIADEDKNITFDAAGGSKTINVQTNTSYSISNLPSWLTVTKSSNGKTLTITAAANESIIERTPHTFYLDGSVAIKVMQRAAKMAVIDGGTITVDNDGGQYGVKVASDVAWTASNSGYSWIDISPSHGDAGTTNVLLTVASNSSISLRTGRVIFTIGGNTACEVKVEQKGLVLNVSPASVSFDADACSRTIDVESNTKWKVLSKPEWITIPTETYDGNKTLTMSATDNNLTQSRSGEIEIGIEGISLTRKITVTQTGRKFDNLVSSLTFTAIPSSQNVTITTDGAWTAEASEPWVSLSKTSGKGTSDVSVSVTENTTDEERNAIVTVTVGDTPQTILIVQKSHYLTISPTSFNTIGSTGGSYTLQIASDCQWTTSKKASWLTVTPASGNGNIDVTVSAADNPSVNTRKDTVIITPQYGQAIKAIVMQDARRLNVSTRELSFFCKGGESEPIVVETDGTYRVSAADSWLTINENGKSFTVTAAENSSADKRESKIIVELTGLVSGESKKIEIPVVQWSDINGPLIEDFFDEEDWSVVVGTSHATITIKAFDSDENWNADTGDSEFTITVTGFSEDNDWNKLIK